jgi:predicted RNase H-like HicB family nuclease
VSDALKYEVIIYWSGDDDAFVAEVPKLPGCAADGPSPQQALENVQLVAREWIETARELGRLVPERRDACSSPDGTSTHC